MSFLHGYIGKKEFIKKYQELFQTLGCVSETVLFDEGFVAAGNAAQHQEPIFNLADNQGLFLGKLFTSSDYVPAQISKSDAQEMVNNPGLVTKKYWGRYIGVLHNSSTPRTTLLRDPLGLATLFYTHTQEGMLFATDLAHLYDALPEKPKLNLEYFAQYASLDIYATEQTPFDGVFELLPGMGLHSNADGSFITELLWDVAQFKGAPIKDIAAFEDELLSVLRKTMKAWIGTTSGVLVELSGGTDSTAMMILLRDVLPDHKNLHAVNFIDTAAPSSNEIEYAQEVADLCTMPLHFIDYDKTQLMDNLPVSWRRDNPSTQLIFHRTTEQIHALARQFGCDQIINGQGGDHVFLAPHPQDSLADYFLDHGFKGISKPLRALSAANRMSWSKLLANGAKQVAQYYGASSSIVVKKYPYLGLQFLGKAYAQQDFLEPYLGGFYPAKKAHIKSLAHGVDFAERNQKLNEIIFTHPLFSQPLVELALRIPTYQSYQDSFDRVIFRNAVSKIKKPKALWRTQKGETTSSMIKAFTRQSNEVEHLLLSGSLMQTGLINRVWLENELVKIRHGHVLNLWPVLRFLTSQMWLNQWGL